MEAPIILASTLRRESFAPISSTDSWAFAAMNEPTTSQPKPTYDPVFINASREAIVIVILFTIMLIWSLSVSIGLGYFSESQTVDIGTVLGLPAWVFWGILIPWIAVDVISIWFCFFFMKDDDLGEVEESIVAKDE